MSNPLFETLKQTMAKRGHDKKFPGAFTVMERAAAVHAGIRNARDAARADKNLSPPGQHARIMDYLKITAPTLQKHRRMIDAARATIAKKREGMKPKFDKVDPAILIAVAAKVAAMKPHEQSAVTTPSRPEFDQVAVQAVLTLPPILTGVVREIRAACESAIMEKNHGAALAAIGDDQEAWVAADAALKTADRELYTAGGFHSPHACAVWLKEIAPPSAQEVAAEARETESFTAAAVLVAAESLSYETRKQLYGDLLDQQTAHINKDGR